MKLLLDRKDARGAAGCRSGALSRRIQRAASLRWLAVVCVLLLLAACSRPGQPVPTTTPVPAAVEAQPGGTLIMALGARDPNTLDPALVSDTESAFLVRQLFSGLVRLDSELAVQPDLAESWTISEDQRSYTFTLRPDAQFADGTPITAEDVRYSLERATDAQLAEFLPAQTYLRDIVGVPEKLSGQANSISGIQVLDERRITITLDGAKSFFLSKLAHPTSFVVDRRAAERGSNWTDDPNGSGPFAIARWDHDRLLELQRNTNFHRDLPRLDGVRFLMGAAANNPLVLYEQGAIDITGVPSYALARVQDENNALSRELLSVPQLSLSYIGMNVTRPPFDDPRVRQAFALLLDRERLAEVTLSESATAARGILPPGMPGYNDELPAGPPDVEAARRLLAESSYGGVENLPPIAAYGGGWAITLRDVAQDALGITIEVRDYEDFGAYLNALDRKEFALFSLAWIADYPDPENFLDVLFRSGSGENHTLYANPAVDALLDEAALSSDEAQRFQLYQQAEQQIIADAPVIPLYHDVEHMLVKPYVKGLTITPMGIIDLSSVALTP